MAEEGLEGKRVRKEKLRRIDEAEVSVGGLDEADREAIKSEYTELRVELSRSIANDDFEDNLKKFPQKASDKDYLVAINDLRGLGISFDLEMIKSFSLEKAKDKEYVELIKYFHINGVFIDGYFLNVLTLRKAKNKRFITAIKDLVESGVTVSGRTIEFTKPDMLYNKQLIEVIKELSKNGIDVKKYPGSSNFGTLLNYMSSEKAAMKEFVEMLEEFKEIGFDQLELMSIIRDFRVEWVLDREFVETLKNLHKSGFRVDSESLRSRDFYSCMKNPRVIKFLIEISDASLFDFQGMLSRVSNLSDRARTDDSLKDELALVKDLKELGVRIDVNFFIKFLGFMKELMTDEKLIFIKNLSKAGCEIGESELEAILDDNIKIFNEEKKFANIKKIIDSGLPVSLRRLVEIDLDDDAAVEKYIKKGKEALQLLSGKAEEIKFHFNDLMVSPGMLEEVKNLKEQGIKISGRVIDLLLAKRYRHGSYGDSEIKFVLKSTTVEFIKMLQEEGREVFFPSDLDDRNLTSDYKEKVRELIRAGLDLSYVLERSLDELNESYPPGWEESYQKFVKEIKSVGGEIEYDFLKFYRKEFNEDLEYMEALKDLARGGIEISLYFTRRRFRPLIMKKQFREFLIEGYKNNISVDYLLAFSVEDIEDLSFRENFRKIIDADVKIGDFIGYIRGILKNDYSIEAIIKLHQAGVELESRLFDEIYPEKIADKNFVNALVKLSKGGVEVDFNFVKALSIEQAKNSQYIDALIRLESMGIYVSEWFLSSFTNDEAVSEDYFAALKQIKNLGVMIYGSVFEWLTVEKAKSQDFQKWLLAMGQLKAAGLLLIDIEFAVTFEKAKSQKYIEVLILFYRSGFYVDSRFIRALDLNMALDQDYVDGLFRLKKMGVFVSVYGLDKFDPQKVRNKKFLDGLEKIKDAGGSIDIVLLNSMTIERLENDNYISYFVRNWKKGKFKPNTLGESSISADIEYLLKDAGMDYDFANGIFFHKGHRFFPRLYEEKNRANASALTVQILEERIKALARPFIIRINQMHDESDEARKEQINPLPLEALFGLTVYGIDELFTSSF